MNMNVFCGKPQEWIKLIEEKNALAVNHNIRCCQSLEKQKAKLAWRSRKQS